MDRLVILEGNKNSFAFLTKHLQQLIPDAAVVDIQARQSQKDREVKQCTVIFECSDRNIMKYIPQNEFKYRTLKKFKHIKFLVFHQQNEHFNFNKFFKSFLKVNAPVLAIYTDMLTEAFFSAKSSFIKQFILSQSETSPAKLQQSKIQQVKPEIKQDNKQSKDKQVTQSPITQSPIKMQHQPPVKVAQPSYFPAAQSRVSVSTEIEEKINQKLIAHQQQLAQIKAFVRKQQEQQIAKDKVIQELLRQKESREKENKLRQIRENQERQKPKLEAVSIPVPATVTVVQTSDEVKGQVANLQAQLARQQKIANNLQVALNEYEARFIRLQSEGKAREQAYQSSQSLTESKLKQSESRIADLNSIMDRITGQFQTIISNNQQTTISHNSQVNALTTENKELRDYQLVNQKKIDQLQQSLSLSLDRILALEKVRDQQARQETKPQYQEHSEQKIKEQQERISLLFEKLQLLESHVDQQGKDLRQEIATLAQKLVAPTVDSRGQDSLASQQERRGNRKEDSDVEIEVKEYSNSACCII